MIFDFYSLDVNIHQRHVVGMAQFSFRKIHETPNQHKHNHERTVVDCVHDGLGQRDQSAFRGLPDGQGGPEIQHRRARATVHRFVAVDAVRAHHLGPVHGQADGRLGQGHVVHGGARVLGRDSRRERAGCAG